MEFNYREIAERRVEVEVHYWEEMEGEDQVDSKAVVPPPLEGVNNGGGEGEMLMAEGAVGGVQDQVQVKEEQEEEVGGDQGGQGAKVEMEEKDEEEGKVELNRTYTTNVRSPTDDPTLYFTPKGKESMENSKSARRRISLNGSSSAPCSSRTAVVEGEGGDEVDTTMNLLTEILNEDEGSGKGSHQGNENEERGENKKGQEMNISPRPCGSGDASGTPMIDVHYGGVGNPKQGPSPPERVYPALDLRYIEREEGEIISEGDDDAVTWNKENEDPRRQKNLEYLHRLQQPVYAPLPPVQFVKKAMLSSPLPMKGRIVAKTELDVLSDQHVCHICAPVPEGAIVMLAKTLQTPMREARIAGCQFLKYLRDHRHLNNVQETFKFLHGTKELPCVVGHGQMNHVRTWEPVKPGLWMQSKPLKLEGECPQIQEEEEQEMSFHMRNNGYGNGRQGPSAKNVLELERAFVPPPQSPKVSLRMKEHRLVELLEIMGRHNGAWGIFEEDEVVITHLNRLAQLLTVLDDQTVRRIVRPKSSKGKHDKNIRTLCYYFAMEKRAWIGLEVLNVLELIAAKDHTSAGVMMVCDLPLDLAKAIYREYIKNAPDSVERLMPYLSMFTFLLQSGFPFPADQLRMLDHNIIYALLQITEGDLKAGASKEIRDAAVGAILALNLHFTHRMDNWVVGAIGRILNEGDEASELDYLKQRMLDLLRNRKSGSFGAQKFFFHSSDWCDMVIKMSMDLLNFKDTSGFFLDTDLTLLISGLIGYIPELEPCEERSVTLCLVRTALHSLNYKYPSLRSLLLVLKVILKEKEGNGVDAEHSEVAKHIARKIARELKVAKLNNANTKM